MPAARSEIRRISQFTDAELAVADDSFSFDPYAMARSDVVLSDEGVKLCEINITSRLGNVLEHDVMAAAVEGDDVLKGVIESLSLRRLAVTPAVRSLLGTCLERAGEGSICITHRKSAAALKEHYLFNVIKLLVAKLNEIGFSAFTASLDDLEIDRNGIVHPVHGRVAVLYRMFGPSDLTASHLSPARLRQLTGLRRVVIIDGFRAESYVTKLLMAMLSSRRWLDQLPAGLAEAMTRYVPWTRLLEDVSTERGSSAVDLIPYAVGHRDSLVLKPGRGSGAMWVVIGAETPQELWERAISSALRSNAPWVVQEYLRSAPVRILGLGEDGQPSEIYRSVNYCGILIGRAGVGVTRRDGPKNRAVLNILQGAAVSPVYSGISHDSDVHYDLTRRSSV